jgi:predicted ATPase/class 3 adenylate cyclase
MTSVRGDLPSGTVTFLFTDVEGSTKLLHELGADEYTQALAEHRRILREAFGAHGGVEVDTQGDACFVAFPTAPGALRAAAEALDGLAPGPIRVRMGIHTGTPHLAEEGYVGVDVHRAARIAACGHGGQVLVSASSAALLDADGLRDLGEHRLKDLSAPECIYQLGDADFPALKSLHQTNLPVPSTPFLGREQELGEVLGLLSQEDVRLLTLTGPGGTGKTRLGLQAAGGLADRYPHGVWWVPLAPLRDPELVLATAGQALGAKDGLAEHIADRSLLLLFDNFEQVVTAAGDLAALLAACPRLDLLVTSREPLHVTGEQEYPVPPFVHEEGVGFFLARARTVEPGFKADDAVSEICRRLDDLPLALELAAARVKALSSQQILARLGQRLPLLTGGARDLPERQRTLRATIEWSFELLTDDERRLFVRLAVFGGGCTLEAAEEVAEAELDTLQSLVDKSLVRHTDERFWTLETIREYATERFEDSGEAEELRRRHAEHFLALAEEAEPNLGASSVEWLDRLEREHDNLRAALDRLEALGETELVLRLAGAASRFWYLKGHLEEGRRRLESALRMDERPTAARAKALNGAALMALNTGDTATTELRAEEALALHRKLGDTWGTANARLMLAHVADNQRDFARAKQLYEESARAFRELDDEHYALLAAYNLAWAYEELGDAERARAQHEDNLGRARALHNERMEAASLARLAINLLDRGRLEEAAPMLKESLRIDLNLGDPLEIALILRKCAYALALEGRAATAAHIFSRALALLEEIGARPGWIAELNEKTLSAIRAQLNEAAFADAWEQGRELTLDEAVALALDFLD